MLKALLERGGSRISRDVIRLSTQLSDKESGIATPHRAKERREVQIVIYPSFTPALRKSAPQAAHG